MKKQCSICGTEYAAAPTSKRITCGALECGREARVNAARRKRLSPEARAKIGEGVRKGRTNKVPFATRWSEECEDLMQAHIARTGASRVATLEWLVLTHLPRE